MTIASHGYIYLDTALADGARNDEAWAGGASHSSAAAWKTAVRLLH
jgi:hypothetical protein